MEYNCISAENKTDQSGGEYEVDSNKRRVTGNRQILFKLTKVFSAPHCFFVFYCV